MTKNIQIASVFILWFLVGCGTSKSVVNELSYTQRKHFEKAYFEGAKQKALGNYEKAEELFNKSLTINDKSHAAMYQLAGLLYRQKQYEEAVTWSKKAVDLSPEYNKWYYGQLAQFYNRTGQFEEAAKTFETMIAHEQSVRNYYIEASNQYVNAGLLDKGIDALVRMQERFGIEELSATRLHALYAKNKQPDLAEKSLRDLVATDESNIEYLGLLSNVLLQQNRVTEATHVLVKMIALDSTVGRAQYSLYEIYSRGGENQKAFAHLKQAFWAEDINIQQKLQGVSHYFLRIKSSEEHRKQLEELSDILLENYPTQIEPYILRADYYSSLGQWSEARSYLIRGLKIDGSDFNVWSKLFTINATIRNPLLQYEDVSQAIERFPNLPSLYLTKGYAAYDLNRFEEAIEAVDQGLEVAYEKNDILALNLCKASSLDKLNRSAEADLTFNKVLQLDPRNATAMNNYAYTLAERGERLSFADSLCTEALAIQSDNAYFMDTKAWILYQLGDYHTAIEWLNKAMVVNPKDIEIYRHARETYNKLGNQTMVNAMEDKIKQLESER